MPALNRIAVGFGNTDAALHDAGDLFGVKTGQRVRVFRFNKNTNREILRHLAVFFFFPWQGLGQGFFCGIGIVQALHAVGQPVQVHFLRTGFIGFLRHQVCKGMLVDGNRQLDDLTRLYIRTGADNKPRIFLQSFALNG